MGVSATCDYEKCGKALLDEETKDERIALVPQRWDGLYPIVRDGQDQLDFCSLAHCVAYFSDAKKARPKLRREEAEVDAEVTGLALEQAERRTRAATRLYEVNEEIRSLRDSQPGDEEGKRDGAREETLRVEQAALVEELRALDHPVVR
jgi:hypothetical protein